MQSVLGVLYMYIKCYMPGYVYVCVLCVIKIVSCDYIELYTCV